jgi:hypothetical protein
MKAFPTEHPIAGTMDFKADGMDLRDYFAAKAMPLITKAYTDSWIEDGDFEGYSEIEEICIAEASYEMADAMMKAREKNNATE